MKPRIPAAQQRTAELKAKVTHGEARAIKKRARAVGRTVSDFLRRLGLGIEVGKGAP